MKSNGLAVYLHGRGGSAAESEHYRPLFPNCDVTGLDYRAQTPIEAATELPGAFDALCEGYDRVILVGNSIGAYFAMDALADRRVDRAYWISPIVDMEALILGMMQWANVSEQALREKGEIPTDFGETLSWDVLCYVRSHPIRWSAPTRILYGAKDSMTSRKTMTAFAKRHAAPLTVMEDGEHWFHTPEQMTFLDGWIREGEGL